MRWVSAEEEHDDTADGRHTDDAGFEDWQWGQVCAFGTEPAQS